MVKRATKRVKHIPQRTCVGCRLVLPKRTLMRLVRDPQGHVQLDPGGKAAGRGAYLHNQRSCWERAMKGALANALKVELTEQDHTFLQGIMASLPADEPTVGQPPALEPAPSQGAKDKA